MILVYNFTLSETTIITLKAVWQSSSILVQALFSLPEEMSKPRPETVVYRPSYVLV